LPITSEKTDAERESEAILRRAVNMATSSKSLPPSNTESSSGHTIEDSVPSKHISTSSSRKSHLETIVKDAGDDQNRLVELLSKHIDASESKLEKDILKCPICMGAYTNPAVSVSCWHVCCSDCWLRVLGAKKLCPKCNNIVSPSQLRKIFL